LRRDSSVIPCAKDEGGSVPKVQYKFKKISTLVENINGLVGKLLAIPCSHHFFRVGAGTNVCWWAEWSSLL